MNELAITPQPAVTFEPQPIDTTEVSLPPQVRELIERLSEHNHNVWAKGRLAEGWTLGPERDDARKEHPCLIPYEQLPDREKEVDRRTAAEVLKAIIALGFRVEPS